MRSIALIPARGGSKRVPGKNIRKLNGVPLLAYTVRAAIDSGCFSKVLVSSDDTETLETAAHYGADCLRRPEALATDTSPDIEWVRHALGAVHVIEDMNNGRARRVQPFDTFSILRPTSPFRLPSTIQRAFKQWKECSGYSSLRAVSPVSQHPGKTWRVVADELVPVLLQPTGTPWHDSQLASLPPVYVQNASLEIAWTSTVEEIGTISGTRIMPFFTEGHEGFDINSERDFMVAVQMVLDGVELPHVT